MCLNYIYLLSKTWVHGFWCVKGCAKEDFKICWYQHVMCMSWQDCSAFPNFICLSCFREFNHFLAFPSSFPVFFTLSRVKPWMWYSCLTGSFAPPYCSVIPLAWQANYPWEVITPSLRCCASHYYLTAPSGCTGCGAEHPGSNDICLAGKCCLCRANWSWLATCTNVWASSCEGTRRAGFNALSDSLCVISPMHLYL